MTDDLDLELAHELHRLDLAERLYDDLAAVVTLVAMSDEAERDAERLLVEARRALADRIERIDATLLAIERSRIDQEAGRPPRLDD